MNFIKHHFLKKELLSLEVTINRFYALSTWRAELENNECNIIQKLLNRYLLHKAIIEYEYLRQNVPSYESRIDEIKIELRNHDYS